MRKVGKALFSAADLFLSSPLGPRILIYHQVGAGLGRQMEVSIENFEWQLDWLSKNREVVDLETAVARWSEPNSDRLVVLSFDDGYRDVFTAAFPRLLEKGLPFVLYLTTGPIESDSNIGDVDGTEALTWEMVRAMNESGLATVGAHTHTHPDLRGVNPDQIEEELATSDDLIEGRTGVLPRHFAYPWGYWSEAANPIVIERYESAVLGGTPSPPVNPPPHQLHRYPVQLSDGIGFFRARLEGGFRAEEKARRLLRRYSGP